MIAKFINETTLSFARSIELADGSWVLNATDEILLANGYKVVDRGTVPPTKDRETLTTTYTDGEVITFNYVVNADHRTPSQKRADYYNGMDIESNAARAGWLASITNYTATGQTDKLPAIVALLEEDNAKALALYPNL